MAKRKAREGAVAIANFDFRASGTVAKSIEIARAVSEAGVPAELWVVRADGPLLDRADGLAVVEVGASSRRAGDRTGALLRSTPRLAGAIRARRPAVFLSGGKHFHSSARVALALSGRRGRTAFGGRASNSARRSDQNVAQRFSSDAALRFKYRDMDFVVAVCDELARELSAKVPEVAPRITTIFNGVDRGMIVERSKHAFTHPFIEPDGPPLLVSVGRISRQKGFDILIEAFALVSRSRAARLLIIGDGPDEPVSALRELARARGIGDRIEFTGYLQNPFAALAKADLFVSSSRWEGASNALIEALACGLPLVATDCPTGSREILAGGRLGTLAPPEDPAGLARAILTELETRRSRHAQHAASARFELQTCLDDYVRLLTAERSRVI